MVAKTQFCEGQNLCSMPKGKAKKIPLNRRIVFLLLDLMNCYTWICLVHHKPWVFVALSCFQKTCQCFAKWKRL